MQRDSATGTVTSRTHPEKQTTNRSEDRNHTTSELDHQAPTSASLKCVFHFFGGLVQITPPPTRPLVDVQRLRTAFGYLGMRIRQLRFTMRMSMRWSSPDIIYVHTRVYIQMLVSALQPSSLGWSSGGSRPDEMIAPRNWKRWKLATPVVFGK